GGPDPGPRGLQPLRRHRVQRHRGSLVMTRQLHLNAFLMGCGHHEAAWRLPDSDPFAHTDLAHSINLAQIAERGTFDSVFLANAPALWGSAKHRPAGALEPTVLLTALAGGRLEELIVPDHALEH